MERFGEKRDTTRHSVKKRKRNEMNKRLGQQRQLSEKNSGATVNPPDGPKDSDLVGGRGDGTKKDRNWGLTPLEIKCLGPFHGSSWAWELRDLGVDSDGKTSYDSLGTSSNFRQLENPP
ncbi:hypothetical protein RUM43_011348 [Polyplax serrata]|uniref:Uncharacterized protein n=1 Tax=Polyplax serrata TaxID=468196 RepID=A0AAN8S075_POLSC